MNNSFNYFYYWYKCSKCYWSEITIALPFISYQLFHSSSLFVNWFQQSLSNGYPCPNEAKLKNIIGNTKQFFSEEIADDVIINLKIEIYTETIKEDYFYGRIIEIGLFSDLYNINIYVYKINNTNNSNFCHFTNLCVEKIFWCYLIFFKKLS